MKIPEKPRPFDLWMNGKWIASDSGAYITRISPAHDCPVTQVPEGSASDVDKAVAAAKASFESGSWASISGAERSAVLYAVADRLVERKEELALLETLESGKPLTQAGFEVEWATGLWKHAVALCRHLYGESCNTLGAGTVWVNTWLEGHPELSFGGYRQSGLGRELGSRAVEEYTEEKSILFSQGKRQPWW